MSSLSGGRTDAERATVDMLASVVRHWAPKRNKGKKFFSNSCTAEILAKSHSLYFCLCVCWFQVMDLRDQFHSVCYDSTQENWVRDSSE